MTIKGRRELYWFLAGGTLGVVVALFLATQSPWNSEVPFFLRPFSILGLAEPKTLSEKIVACLMMYGGNFLLYGFLGMIVNHVLDRRTG